MLGRRRREFNSPKFDSPNWLIVPLTKCLLFVHPHQRPSSPKRGPVCWMIALAEYPGLDYHFC